MNESTEDRDPVGAYVANLANQEPEAETPETPEEPDQDAETEEEPSAEAEEEEEEEEEEEATPEEETGRTPSNSEIAAALKERFGDAGADVFTQMQSRVDRVANAEERLEARGREIEAVAADVNDKIDLFEQRTEAQAEGEPTRVEKLMEGVDPSQRELFLNLLDAVVEEKGLVAREDLDQRDLAQVQTTVTRETNKQGVELYGEDFGALDGETFTPNPAYLEKAAPTLQRIMAVEQGGQGALGHLDIYRLANFDDLMAAAEEKGRNEATSETNTRSAKKTRRVKKAAVATNSAAAAAGAVIYDRSDDKQVGDVKGFIDRWRTQLQKV